MGEGLEEIKRETKPMAKMVDPPIYYREIKEDDYKYLIEQAEQAADYSKKANEVQQYLQENKIASDNINYWGRNVIDVLLSVSIEQTEKVEELEEYNNEINVWNHGHRNHINKLKNQNKRYEKALKTIPSMLIGRTDQILQDEVIKYITEEAIGDNGGESDE